MTREQFMRKMKGVEDSFKALWELEKQLDDVELCAMDKIYRTSIVAQILLTIKIQFHDKNFWFYRIVEKEKMAFPMTLTTWDFKKIPLNDWGDVYDQLLKDCKTQEERNFIATKDQFIDRAISIENSIQKFWKLEKDIANSFGCGFIDKFYDTSVFATLVHTLQDFVNDRDNIIFSCIYCSRLDFPVKIMTEEDDLIILNDWGEVYDKIVNKHQS